MRQLLRWGFGVMNAILSPLRLELHRTGLAPDTLAYAETSRPEVPRYVNIGAGSFFHPYWHNLDNPNEYYESAQNGSSYISYDLTSHQRMPFDDDTLKVAYTSHVLEHISDYDVEFVLREVHRCLQPGGYFRITCPDMDLEYDAYLRGDEHFWQGANAYGVYNTRIEQKFLDHFATALTESHPATGYRKLTDEEVRDTFCSLPKAEAFDSIIGQLPTEIQKDHCGDHINWFNADKLMTMLQRAGFSTVYESKYGQSCSPILRDTSLFDSTCPGLSLYVECRK